MTAKHEEEREATNMRFNDIREQMERLFAEVVSMDEKHDYRYSSVDQNLETHALKTTNDNHRLHEDIGTTNKRTDEISKKLTALTFRFSKLKINTPNKESHVQASPGSKAELEDAQRPGEASGTHSRHHAAAEPENLRTFIDGHGSVHRPKSQARAEEDAWHSGPDPWSPAQPACPPGLQERAPKRPGSNGGGSRRPPGGSAASGGGGGDGDSDGMSEAESNPSNDAQDMPFPKFTSTFQRIDRKQWKLSEVTIPKSFKPFTGKSEDYRFWRDRVIHIAAKGNQKWRHVLNWVLKQKDVVNFRAISQTSALSIPAADWDWLAREFWTFVSDMICEPLYLRRKILAGGEDENGMELWRRFHVDHEGGAAVIELGGARNFLLFPRCNDIGQLAQHLDHWFIQYQEHGGDIPRDLLFEMFMQIIPAPLEKELRLEKSVTCIHSAYAYLMSELSRLNSDRLAKIHNDRRKNELDTKGQSDFIHALTGSGESTDPLDKLIAAPEKRMHKTFGPASVPGSANGAPQRTTAAPKWKDGACWHCGIKGHTTKDCRKLIAPKKKAWW